MAEYEEAGYYEIQLNNKQLFFFFMAALAIAVVVFLCGVMVGRGVRDQAIAAAGISLVTDSEPAASAGGVTPGDIRRELDYPQRLEAPVVEDRLESTNPEQLVAAATKPAPPPPATASARAPEPSPSEARSARAEGGKYTIQVVALKTREAAESLVERLGTRGFNAYLDSAGDRDLYRVRVGRYETRAEADQAVAKIAAAEKLKPFVVPLQ